MASRTQQPLHALFVDLRTSTQDSGAYMIDASRCVATTMICSIPVPSIYIDFDSNRCSEGMCTLQASWQGTRKFRPSLRFNIEIKLPRSLYYHAANHTRRIQTQLGAFALCITDSKPQTSQRRTTRIRRSQRAITSVSELDVFSSCWSQLFLKSPSQTLHDILDPGLVERILDLLERPTPGLWHIRRQHGNGA